MAHELTTNRISGAVEMAYTGELPWHGLGQELPPGARMETWLESAGMEWTVRRSKVMYYADRAQTDLRADNDNVVLTRSDTGDRLGIVSADYSVVQPFEVLEFFRSLVEDNGFQLHTAGTLFGGKRYWALAKVAEAVLPGNDKVGGFLLLSTSSDGSRATEARETTVRVVCNNTLSAAFAGPAPVARSTHRSPFNPAMFKAQLDFGVEGFGQFVEAAKALTKIKVGEAAAEAFLMSLLRPGTKDEDAETVRRPRGMDTVLALFDGAGRGSALIGAEGTAWGLLNAVTEYVDHFATAQTVSHRLDRALFGSGAEMKTEAFKRLITQGV